MKTFNKEDVFSIANAEDNAMIIYVNFNII